MPTTNSNSSQDQVKKNKQKTHPILRNSCAIKWFRNHAKSQVLENTLNSIVDNQHKNKSLRNISEFNKNDMRSKHLYLKPDVLYSPTKVAKIEKLKEIFLQFDNDNSSNFYFLFIKKINHNKKIFVVYLWL